MRNEYERESSTTTKLTYLLVGGGIGAILALLFAPKTGEELRGDIADATRKGIEKGKETAGQLQEKAGEYYEVTRDKAGEYYQTAQQKVGELKDKAQETVGDLKDKASELTEKAKSAVAQSSNPLTAAIEAGKDAYTDEKRKTEAKAITEGRPSYPVEKKEHQG